MTLKHYGPVPVRIGNGNKIHAAWTYDEPGYVSLCGSGQRIVTWGLHAHGGIKPARDKTLSDVDCEKCRRRIPEEAWTKSN